MQRRLLTAVCCCLVAHVVTAHREHKVHNIVLYPDKHSWCKTTPIKQVVTFPGCSSVEIDNNVCVGACFSYSIPRTAPSAPGELIKPYCDSCQPSAVTWQHVALDCTGEEKRVQIIHNCSCSTCDPGDELSSSGDGEIGLDHKATLPDLGDLIDFMNKTQKQNKGPAAGEEGNTGKRLLQLLRQLGEGSQLDDATLHELLRQADHIKVNLHELEHHRHHHHHQDPTLDMAPHHFKPALEGSELSYHDNLVPSDAPDDQDREEI